MFLRVLFWLFSYMMQLDGRYFLNICSESEEKAEANVIQNRMNTRQQNQITSSNRIDQCKQKLQIGILLIDANLFASLLIPLIVKLEHLFLSPLPPWSLCLADRQFQIYFFRNQWWKLLCSRTVRIQAGKVLRIPRYAKIANSCICALCFTNSHLHSQSVGAPTVMYGWIPAIVNIVMSL